MERNNKDLQARLDIEKWLDSEKAGVDRCGSYPHCVYCRMQEEYEFTCARAVRRMIIANRKSKQ
ncbi:MAG: hypothetical protein IKB56_01475 [Clostridia bacterium]|nr:hypothetical protein [Clostridia bacterium]